MSLDDEDVLALIAAAVVVFHTKEKRTARQEKCVYCGVNWNMLIYEKTRWKLVPLRMKTHTFCVTHQHFNNKKKKAQGPDWIELAT